MSTAQHELIDAKLPPGTTLRVLVSHRRRSGVGWRAISNEVRDSTGVFVSHTTLRRWFPDKMTMRRKKACA